MNTDCARVRIAVMAQLDDEGLATASTDRDHLATCEACQRWRVEFLSLSGNLQALAYLRADIDLWTAVGDRLHQAGDGWVPPRWLWPIAGGLVAWRALQLFVDLPIPALHPIVPLLATIAAVWMVAEDPLRIETTAPELRKRDA